MAASFKAVSDTMEDMNIILWKVKGRGNSLIGYNNDLKLSIDASIGRLKKLLLEQKGDFVRVELDPPNKKGSENVKGGDTTTIKMEVDLSTLQNTSSINGINTNHSSDYSKLEKMINDLREENKSLQLAAIENKYQGQIEDLKKQINGVDDDPIGRIVELVIPILSTYLPQMLSPKQPSQINGVPDDDDTNSIIDRIKSVIPNLNFYLEKFAVMAENDPDKLKNLLKLI